MNIICFGYCEWGPNLHESGPQHWLKWCVLLILLLWVCCNVPLYFSHYSRDRLLALYLFCPEINLELQMNNLKTKQIRISSCMTGVRMKLGWLFGVCWVVLLVSQSWRVNKKQTPQTSSHRCVRVTSQPVRGHFTQHALFWTFCSHSCHKLLVLIHFFD